MVYINQLHLTVVMLLTGRIKLVEKAEGEKRDAKAPDKEVVVAQEPEKAAQTCSAEQKAKVKELIAAYVKTGPALASSNTHRRRAGRGGQSVRLRPRRRPPQPLRRPRSRECPAGASSRLTAPSTPGI